MAKSVTVLQTLVAYPDDVAEERAILEEVVNELNNSWSDALGREIHLIDWKTRVTPDFGIDAQDVINQQLGEEYDIFLGIMWLRFGEPTPRAESGTAEEFNRALERLRKDPSRLRIMFYFKDAPPKSLKELDPHQLTLVREFKAKVSSEGGLYKEFKRPEEFSTYVRMHLGRQLREWGSTWGVDKELPSELSGNLMKIESGEPITSSNENDYEDGFLDLIERSNEGFETLSEILAGMKTELQTFTKRIQDKTNELNEANESGQDIGHRKRVINSTSEIMDQYSLFLEEELPRYSSSFSVAVDSMARALSMWHEDQMQGQEQVETAHESLRQIRGALLDYHQSMVGFQNVIEGLPRLTSAFNRSKRRMSMGLTALLAEIQRQIDLTADADKLVLQILGTSEDESDFEEQVWIKATSNSRSFDFLHDSTEDIYTLADGVPFNG